MPHRQWFAEKPRQLLDWIAGLSERRPNLCRRVVPAGVAVLLLGALAAAPGSVAMLRASPVCFSRPGLLVVVLFGRAFLFSLNAPAVARSNLYLFRSGHLPVLRKLPSFEASIGESQTARMRSAC